ALQFEDSGLELLHPCIDRLAREGRSRKHGADQRRAQEKGGLKSLGSVAFLDIHLGCPRKSQLLKNLRGGDEPGLAAGLVDLVEYTPVAEMFRLCLHPTAELVVDGEELHLHETVRIFL